MKTLQNQKGFGIGSMIAVLIAIGVLSYFLMQAGVETKKAIVYANSKNFYEQLDATKDAILAYQVDKNAAMAILPNTFPSGFSDLIPNYLPDCSTANQKAGNCRHASYTPWGSKISLTRQTQHITGRGYMPYNRIVIPLPPVTGGFKFEHDVQVSTLLKLPFARYSPTANTITWEVRRIGEESQHDALVRRSGDDSTLLGDWDVGGKFAITNAKDVTVRNSDGSQRSLSVGNSFIVAKHNQRIKKHKCPTGLTPAIVTSIKGIFNASNPTIPLNNIGAQRGYSVSSGRYWTVKLDYWTDIKGKKTFKHDGEVNVQLICQP